MAQVRCFPSGPFKTNAYLLFCMETSKGVFIDPAPGSAEDLTRAAEGIQVEAVLLTHSHWDHIGDLKKIKTHFEIPVYIHPKDKRNVVCPGSDGIPLIGTIGGVEPEFDLKEGQSLSIGHLDLKVIETPGHTPGGVCFYLEKEKVLFAGDTVFKGSIGNLSLPTANRSDMWHSLEKLKKLPPDTIIYSGHGPATKIGDEDWLSHVHEILT